MLRACNMCCYSFRSPDLLVDHIITKHKNDPRFNVYCSLCLRSFTKWDSYRKHIQRGCTAIPSVNVPVNVPSSLPDPFEERVEERQDERSEDIPEQLSDNPILNQTSWHEAAYILNIKEQYVISQTVVDYLLSATKVLVSDILNGIADSIRDSVPSDVMKVIENEMKLTNSSLFKGLDSAFLQKSFFKEHFNLVVSYSSAVFSIADTL